MNAIEILHYYIDPNEALYQVVYQHSRAVADLALRLMDKHPALPMNRRLVEQAALLHDIGVLKVDAPSIHCFGTDAYIRHGVEGAAMLRALIPILETASFASEKTAFDYATEVESLDLTAADLEACARVCERHTGTGLTVERIVQAALPLPLQDFSPQSEEEQLICFADKFFSKTHLDRERDFAQARAKLEKFGPESLQRFDNWGQRFL